MIAPILLLAALFVSMLFDLRTREVPAVLTIGSLFGAAAIGLWQGLWSPVLLIVSLSHIADFNPREKRLAFSAVTVAFCCIFQPAPTLVSLAIYALWLFWEFGLMGGADAKLLMAALLVFGNIAVLAPVAMAGGVLGIVAGLRSQRQIPYVPAIFSGTALFWAYQFI
jgi:Flp pilus assembly protein protease CpaA